MKYLKHKLNKYSCIYCNKIYFDLAKELTEEQLTLGEHIVYMQDLLKFLETIDCISENEYLIKSIIE